MCRQAWCLRAVLEQTLGLLDRAAAGDLSHRALFTALAEGFGASAAAHVVVEPASGSATVTIWSPLADRPDPSDTDTRAPDGSHELLERLPQTLPLLVRRLEQEFRTTGRTTGRTTSRPVADTHSSWQETVGPADTHEDPGGADIAQVPLHPDGATLSAAVLVRSHPFDPHELHVLDALRAPISSLARLTAPTSSRSDGPGTCSPVAESDHLAGLTSREVDVLRLVAEGLLATSIAARLDVSPRTVHKHLGNVYRKLDAHDRLLAVRRAEMLGLLERRQPAGGHDGEVVLTLRW